MDFYHSFTSFLSSHCNCNLPGIDSHIKIIKRLMNIGLAYTALDDRLKINGFYRVSRDATDEIFGSPVDLDDFEVLDISARYRITDNFSIYARLENAFDEDYEEITGFYSPDRAAYLGFKLNFSAN